MPHIKYFPPDSDLSAEKRNANDHLNSSLLAAIKNYRHALDELKTKTQSDLSYHIGDLEQPILELQTSLAEIQDKIGINSIRYGNVVSENARKLRKRFGNFMHLQNPIVKGASFIWPLILGLDGAANSGPLYIDYPLYEINMLAGLLVLAGIGATVLLGITSYTNCESTGGSYLAFFYKNSHRKPVENLATYSNMFLQDIESKIQQ
jgi:hypothetical protein